MFRAVSLLASACLGISTWVAAQQPAPSPAPAPIPVPSAEERSAAAAVQAPQLPPPVIPPSEAPAAPPAPGSFIAPPLPGQLKAESAPATAPAPVTGAPAVGPDTAPSNPLKTLPPAVVPAKDASSAPVPQRQDLKPVSPVPLTKNKPVSSTSSSGQFIVHGDDLPLRNAFSRRCDEISDELRRLLRDKEPWGIPIVVLLKTGEAARSAKSAVSYTVSQIPSSGFHLQLNVNVRGDLRPAELRAEVIRVLLAERVLRNQKEIVGNRQLLLPDWVYTGVLEAMDFRQRARPSALFAAIFKSGKIYSIEEIIEASPVDMDALSKTIYQTSCCALVLALIDQPEGAARLNRFLNSLASDERPERELLNLAFPNFAATPASLNKWWSLQLAALSKPNAAELLSAKESVQQIEAALMLQFKAKRSEVPNPQTIASALTKVRFEEEKPTPHPVPVLTGPTVATKAASKAAEPASSSSFGQEKTVADAEKKTAEEKTEAKTEEPTKKPSFFHRLNPFARRTSSDDQVIAKAAKEAAMEEIKAEEAQAGTPEPAGAMPEPKVAVAEAAAKDQDKDKEKEVGKEKSSDKETTKEVPAKKSFLGWLFGSDSKDKDKAEEAKIREEQKKQAATEKKAAEEKAAEEKAKLAAAKKAEEEKKAAEAEAQRMAAKQAEEKTKEEAAEKERVAAEKKAMLAAVEKADKEKKERAAEEKEKAAARAAEAKKEAEAKQKETRTADAAVAKTDAKASSKPKADSSVTTTEKGPGKKKSLNWFRRGKKDRDDQDKVQDLNKTETKDGEKAEKPAEKKGKDKAQSSLSNTALQFVWVWSPLAADVIQVMQLQTERAPEGRYVAGLFGFGKKKEKAPDAEDSEPESKAKAKDEKTESKEETKSKTEPKKAEKKEPAPKAESGDKEKQKDKVKDAPADTGKRKENEKNQGEPKADKQEKAKANAESSSSESQREPIKIKPLFGGGKKEKDNESEKEADKKEPEAPKEPTSQAASTASTGNEMPKEATPAPTPVPAPSGEKEQSKHKKEPKVSTAASKSSKKAKDDEPLLDFVLPIENYAAIMKRPDRAEILNRNRVLLTVLQNRCGVLFRPIVLEYTEVITNLIEGKTRGVDEKLRDLRARTVTALMKTIEVRDLMDLHEANESVNFSGVFDDYLKLPDTISKELPPRTDSISKYLDALDKEFSGQ